MSKPEHNDEVIESRRRFLKTVAVTGGAAAVTLGAGTAVAEMQEGPEPEASREKHGYRETPHIKDYYAKAGF